MVDAMEVVLIHVLEIAKIDAQVVVKGTVPILVLEIQIKYAN